jgi:hypothetical protein
MAAAAAGLFGEALKRFYEKISEHDKSKGIVIPVGYSEEKPVYFHLPHNDSDRMLAGVMWKLLNGKGFEGPGEALGLATGEMPGLNPFLQMANKWGQFLAGKNPRDDFRNRDIVGRDEQLVGGWARLKPMLLWTTDQGGELGRYIRIAAEWERNTATGEKTTTFEKTVTSVPGLSRLLKVSDRGETERMWADVDEEREATARAKMSMPQAWRDLVKERYRLNTLGDERLKPAQRARRKHLNAWYTQTYLPRRKATATQ